MSASNLQQILAEIYLIKCSLLFDEYLTFIGDDNSWNERLAVYEESPESVLSSSEPTVSCQFEVRGTGCDIWFEVEMPPGYPHSSPAVIRAKGSNFTRRSQQDWQDLIYSKQREAQEDSVEFTVHHLLALHLLPSLHNEVHRRAQEATTAALFHSPQSKEEPEPVSHALLTSHHLISPNKRRSLQSWSAELAVRGFAKVGYPGIIYCEGEHSQVAEFVSRVKAMQWLALRVRFVDKLEYDKAEGTTNGRAQYASTQWQEYEKVGEVVEYMRKIGRDQFVTDLGIGSAGGSIQIDK